VEQHAPEQLLKLLRLFSLRKVAEEGGDFLRIRRPSVHGLGDEVCARLLQLRCLHLRDAERGSKVGDAGGARTLEQLALHVARAEELIDGLLRRRLEQQQERRRAAFR